MLVYLGTPSLLQKWVHAICGGVCWRGADSHHFTRVWKNEVTLQGFKTVIFSNSAPYVSAPLNCISKILASASICVTLHHKLQKIRWSIKWCSYHVRMKKTLTELSLFHKLFEIRWSLKLCSHHMKMTQSLCNVRNCVKRDGTWNCVLIMWEWDWHWNDFYHHIKNYLKGSGA